MRQPWLTLLLLARLLIDRTLTLEHLPTTMRALANPNQEHSWDLISSSTSLDLKYNYSTMHTNINWLNLTLGNLFCAKCKNWPITKETFKTIIRSDFILFTQYGAYGHVKSPRLVLLLSTSIVKATSTNATNGSELYRWPYSSHENMTASSLH